MILHIIHNEKFTKPFIKFLEQNFDVKEHVIIILGKGKNFEIEECEFIVKINKKISDQRLLVSLLNKSNKIVIHGLFSSYLVFILGIQPWLLKKCYWAIWGGDLYVRNIYNSKKKYFVLEKNRQFIIKRFKGFITYIKGDYEYVKEWYGAKGEYYECFLYPSNLFCNVDKNNNISDEKVLTIQIGNSADISNNHQEILTLLEKYKNRNIEIICPLSYGNLEYCNRVCSEGSEIFGEKFIPLREFVSKEEYNSILSKVDIAIFNHNRQQAMGNIITLLGMGKTIYINSKITTWDFCKEKNLNIFDIKELREEKKLLKITNVEREENEKIIRKIFTEKTLIDEWKKIFDEGE